MPAKEKKIQVEDFKKEFTSALKRIRSMRKHLKEESLDSLVEMRDKFDLLINERKEAEIAEAKALEDKKANIAMLRELMEEQGLTDSDLINPELVPGIKAKSPKYLYVDKDARKHRWNGKGIKPKIYKKLIESGVNIDKSCMARDVEPRLLAGTPPHPDLNF